MTRTRPPVLALVTMLGLTSVFWTAAEIAESSIRYYRSNEIGIPFEEISETKIADHRFVLVHLQPTAISGMGEGGGDERQLLEDGYQVRSWVTRRGVSGDRLSESSFIGGELVAERNFDVSGRLAGSATYEAGAMVSRSIYTYEPRLVRVEVVGPDGAVQFCAAYHLSATGQLRDFVRIAPGEDRTGVRFMFAGGALLEEVITTSSTRLVSRYLSGEIYQTEEWRDGTLHTVRDSQRSANGALTTETVTEPERERRTTTRFDGADRVLEVMTIERGRELELIRHERDAAGRIVTTIRRSPDREERWHYYYLQDVLSARSSEAEPDERLRSQRYEQDGLLVSVTTYEVDATEGEDDTLSAWQIEFYRDGVPIRRERYRGDMRTHEQVLRDGQVIRERALNAANSVER